MILVIDIALTVVVLIILICVLMAGANRK